MLPYALLRAAARQAARDYRRLFSLITAAAYAAMPPFAAIIAMILPIRHWLFAEPYAAADAMPLLAPPLAAIFALLMRDTLPPCCA